MNNIKSKVFTIILAASCFSFCEQISIYNSEGEAVAYIDTDKELTIYLWGGKPVAYLDGGKHIYGFNGEHLGWFDDGIIRDNKGYISGFLKGALNVSTKFEKFKGFQQFSPFKSFKKFAPMKPMYASRWSKIPLGLLLSMGRD